MVVDNGREFVRPIILSEIPPALLLSCHGVTGSPDQSAAFTFSRDKNRRMNQTSRLSGVFKLSDLRAAQAAGLYLVWSHDIDGFIEWVKAQT
jgi:hypothetical protein